MQNSVTVWELGKSDGKFLISEGRWDRTTEFPDSELIAKHLGFPIGSRHSFAYGVMADGSHEYEVESIERGRRLAPDNEVYGYEQYYITLRFVQDLTPNSHWSRIGCKSSPTQTVFFQGPTERIEGLRNILKLPRAIMLNDGHKLRNQNCVLSVQDIEALNSYQEKELADKEVWEMTFNEFHSTIENSVTCGGMGGFVSVAFEPICVVGAKARLRIKYEQKDHYVKVQVVSVSELFECGVKVLEDVKFSETFSYKKGQILKQVYSSQLHPMPDNDVYKAYVAHIKKAYLEGLPIGTENTNRREWAQEAFNNGVSLPLQCLADIPFHSGLHEGFLAPDDAMSLNREYRDLQAKAKNKKHNLSDNDQKRIIELEAISEKSNKAYWEFVAVRDALQTCQEVPSETLSKYPDLQAKFSNYPYAGNSSKVAVCK